MRYRSLGPSGLMVSVAGVGCNAFGTRIDAQRTQEVVDAALEVGVTLFDTADTYGLGASEELLGRALGDRRDEVVVATKFGMPASGLNGSEDEGRASRDYLRRAVHGSLRRLGTDWIDLYQLHQPDLVTPYDETLGALQELVDEGKIRHYGCSNFQAWELVDAQWTAQAAGLSGFVSAQNEYSLYNRTAEAELVPTCERFGIGLLPYFPLAYGLLTGKYSRRQAAPPGSRLAAENQRHRLEGADFGRVDVLQQYADESGISLLDVALGGLAAQPTVASVIAGATRGEQVRANVSAGLWEPSGPDLKALAELNTGPAVGLRYSSFRPVQSERASQTGNPDIKDES
ncbi:MAG TPA: aldo/keto reductase [Nocardioidaceae bacterium]|nr:aldo/keto reductase [Nocardioidaceae bacterium]